MKKFDFFKKIKDGIPNKLPYKKKYDQSGNHAPLKNKFFLILKSQLLYFMAIRGQ